MKIQITCWTGAGVVTLPHGPGGGGALIVRISSGRREAVDASDELIRIVDDDPRLISAKDRRPDRIVLVTSKETATPDVRCVGECAMSLPIAGAFAYVIDASDHVLELTARRSN